VSHDNLSLHDNIITDVGRSSRSHHLGYWGSHTDRWTSCGGGANEEAATPTAVDVSILVTVLGAGVLSPHAASGARSQGPLPPGTPWALPTPKAPLALDLSRGGVPLVVDAVDSRNSGQTNCKHRKKKQLKNYLAYRGLKASRNRLGGGVEPPSVAALLVLTATIGEEPEPAESSVAFFAGSAFATLVTTTSSATSSTSTVGGP
jgi:hypothetical protein